MKKWTFIIFLLFPLTALLTSCSKGSVETGAEEGEEGMSFVIAYCYQPLQNGIHQIYTINPDGGNNRKVIDASFGLNHHDCSPDGKKFAAVGYRGENFSTWSIHVFDAEGTNLKRLTAAEGLWDSEPIWSPDGEQIVFTRIYPNEGRREEIWLMNADGSNQHYLGVEGFAAKWSLDGERFIYTAKRNDNYDIYTCSIEGGDERKLTDTTANESFPAFSPDGRQIAYCASTGDYSSPDNAHTFEIYVMNSDGTGIRQLTDNDFCDMYPRWSPDGSRLAFASDRHETNKWEVYVMDPDGTNIQRVTNSPPGITAINPSWKLD